MKIKTLHQIFLNCSKVITDSRKAEKSALFFALKGDNFDGNAYAKIALENGCSYAVIDNPGYKLDDRYILVNNVLETLQLLGQYHRIQLNIPIIAITGTNGKTTTKELVACVLSKKYSISYTKGNLNNHIGVPLTLLEMNKGTEIGIVEMGANHIGEINLLCEIAKPDFGIITNIGKAHLDGFGSFDNIIKAKSELYDYLRVNNGIAFYNSSNPVLKKINKELGLKSIQFGDKNSIIHSEILPTDKFLTLKISVGDLVSDVKTNLIGNYNLENVLAAVCIGNYRGVSLEDMVSAIEDYAPTNNRSQFLKTENNNLFLDAYNANPTSVEASVKNFVSLDLKNKCIVLGDMLELGKDSKKEHKKIIDLLGNYVFGKVILVGEIYSSLVVNQDYLKFLNVNELKDWLVKNEVQDSNILIKGSRGISLEKAIEYL